MIKRVPVVYRPEARSDLRHFYYSILSISQSFETADRYIDRLQDRCERVGDAPLGGRAFGPREKGFRLVPFERSAIIVYRVVAGKVIIHNIFSGRSDYARLLADDQTP